MDYRRDMEWAEKEQLAEEIENGLFNDRRILKQIVLDKDEEYLLRSAALCHIDDQDFLFSVASDLSMDIVLRGSAMRRITDPTMIEQLANTKNISTAITMIDRKKGRQYELLRNVGTVCAQTALHTTGARTVFHLAL